MTTRLPGIARPTVSPAQRLHKLRRALVTRWRNTCDRLKWLGHKPSTLELFAERELRLAGWFDAGGVYGDMPGHAVLKMVRALSRDGRPGVSARLVTSLFKHVAAYAPLTPLTGACGEWGAPDNNDGTQQNIRCRRVFRNADGYACDSGGRGFCDPSGVCHTGRKSAGSVSDFPTPRSRHTWMRRGKTGLPCRTRLQS